MNKKELEKMREKMRAENPLLTDEQIEDIIAESESGSGGVGEGNADPQPSLAPDANALTEEKAAIEAEKEALAKERAAIEADKKRLAEKEAALTDAVGTAAQTSGAPGISDSGKAVTYECKTRCTFNGQYYREGDRLTTTGDVPDFFEAVEGA